MTSSFEAMTDVQLVDTLREIDPLATNLSDLLVEMWKRQLDEAREYAMDMMAGNRDGKLHRHPDKRLYDVLEVMCGCFDGHSDEGWLRLSYGYEQRILDVLMVHALRENRRAAYETLEFAIESDYYEAATALWSIVRNVPVDDPELQACLLHWVAEPTLTPDLHAAILRRLAELPWNEELEAFFVQACIDDNGDDPAITAAIDAGLNRCK